MTFPDPLAELLCEVLASGRLGEHTLVDTFYNESIDVGIARNDLAHNTFDATRGFQNIDWRELARRMIVSIAFLDETVVCSYSDWTDASSLRKFERWLAEREPEGFDNLQDSG